MFELDSRLVADTYVLGDFPLSRLLLMNDSKYPWFILVPRKEGVSEIFDLDLQEQKQLWQESTALAERIKDVFAADKINIATLGNVVSQLHMHVIVRRRSDAAWPAPVWGKHAVTPYSDSEIQAVRQKLKMALADQLQFVGGDDVA